MKKLTKLQLAKDFIELSLLISPDKNFSLPVNDKDDIYQQLYKAVSELKKEGVINTVASTDNAIIITLKRE